MAHAATSSNNIRIVYPNSSIQKAINEATEGDTILVKSGTYREYPIIVNKTLTIIGENMEDTIIDGEGLTTVIFLINASNVVLENFTLQNAHPTWGAALRVYRTDNVKVRRVNVKNSFYGVELVTATLTKITGCISKSNIFGVYVRDRSRNNTFIANVIESNKHGIQIADVESQFNLFYYNNFINNTDNDFFSFASNYYLDNGYPSGGNFWDKLTYKDLKHGVNQNEEGPDGLHDEGYQDDKYPLINPIRIVYIQAADETFEIYTSSNSTLLSNNFNAENQTLTLTLNGTLRTFGALRLTIPKKLLSCSNLDEWRVSSNIENLLILEDRDFTYIFCVYKHDHPPVIIRVIGRYAIPEFTNILSLLLTLRILLQLLTLVKSSRKRM
uniref:Periplasmic copper-binding protein NosD beta helix domain-containing protein n=1 Tax=Fervidobacterium pennivorans TaxID=93466 RepID=A0A7C4RXS1_FERPE